MVLCNREIVRLIKAGMAGVNRHCFSTDCGDGVGPGIGPALSHCDLQIQSFRSWDRFSMPLFLRERSSVLSAIRPGIGGTGGGDHGVVELDVSGERLRREKLKALAHELSRYPPETVRISHPEGFAYYALHPGDFADAMRDMSSRVPVAVVGIRSIGTTLSAVACAALRRRGVRASRITVRPSGHPYDRTTELTDSQRDWVREQQRDTSRFMVVDEGPGLSGSSFLSVAECLMREGVGAESITLVGTRDVDPAQLCASNANSRWKKFGWRRVSSRISQRFQSSTSLSGGAWRQFFLDHRAEQPAYWPEMDCAKYWSADRKHVFKFEGLGESGRTIRHRSRILHEAGFGARVENAGDGVSCYDFVAGRPLDASDLSTSVLDRIAEYCAFRAHEFRHDAAAEGQFEDMLRFNFSQETGRDWPAGAENFQTHYPVIADGRMAPHEWIRSQDARLIKVDASQHGDDHFFPGPTDIHWDLASAIVEWNMDADAEQYLLSRFRAEEWNYA